MRIWRKCKDVGYWRSLGVEMKVWRGPIDPKTKKQAPLMTARGNYRRRVRALLAAAGKRCSRRQVVRAGKILRHLTNIQATALAGKETQHG